MGRCVWLDGWYVKRHSAVRAQVDGCRGDLVTSGNELRSSSPLFTTKRGRERIMTGRSTATSLLLAKEPLRQHLFCCAPIHRVERQLAVHAICTQYCVHFWRCGVVAGRERRKNTCRNAAGKREGAGHIQYRVSLDLPKAAMVGISGPLNLAKLHSDLK